jgi:hypothetical protein
MSTLFSLKKQVEVPERIILPTQVLVEELRRRLRLAECMVIGQDEDDLLEVIFNSLVYENKAEFELACNAIDIVKQAMGGLYEDSVTEFANAVVSFGGQLVNDLRAFKLYQDGYLHYQMSYTVFGDIVLQRLYVDRI